MRVRLSIIIILLSMLFGTISVLAQTPVYGSVSGTWDIDGSPYLMIDDCTVNTGNELIIEPGVEIIISDSISLNVYGELQLLEL